MALARDVVSGVLTLPLRPQATLMDPIELAQSRATRCKEGGARAPQLEQSRRLLGSELRLHLIRVRVRVRARVRVRVGVRV